jgi:transposase
MMGRLDHDQGQFFYSFRLDEVVPDDHPVRAIAGVLDLSWMHSELAAFYSKIGRPSIDPVLMMRMLLVGYVFAIRSERMLCREVKVNMAYRWFCGLSLEDKIPDHSAFSRARNERICDSDIFRQVFEHVVEACIAAGVGRGRRVCGRCQSDCGGCQQAAGCLFKAQCCPKAAFRIIPRSIYEDARDAARALAKTEAFEQSRRDRKRVEMLFAHLKRILWLGRLRLRGPCGAQFEFTMAAIAQNLRRLAKLSARPPPAVDACLA